MRYKRLQCLIPVSEVACSDIDLQSVGSGAPQVRMEPDFNPIYFPRRRLSSQLLYFQDQQQDLHFYPSYTLSQSFGSLSCNLGPYFPLLVQKVLSKSFFQYYAVFQHQLLILGRAQTTVSYSHPATYPGMQIK